MTKTAAVRWSATLFAGVIAGYLVQSIAFSDSSQVRRDDRGLAAAVDQRVLTSTLDHELGIEWRLKSYTSDSGLCIDVEATQHGSPVGSVGSCHTELAGQLRDAALGLPASDSGDEREALVTVGFLAVADRSYLVTRGLVSCGGCSVRARMPDGSTVRSDAPNRAFVITYPVDSLAATDMSTPIRVDKSKTVVVDLFSDSQQFVRSYTIAVPFG